MSNGGMGLQYGPILVIRKYGMQVRLGDWEVTPQNKLDCNGEGPQKTCLPPVQDFTITESQVTVHKVSHIMARLLLTSTGLYKRSGALFKSSEKMYVLRDTMNQYLQEYGRKSNNILNDIALIKLDRPAVLNRGVQVNTQ